jgi:hypothetical protein
MPGGAARITITRASRATVTGWACSAAAAQALVAAERLGLPA